MAFGHVMEALARIEHKLDALLRWTGTPMPPPMHFLGQVCPACGMPIDYQVDINQGVVVRRCDCKTGKIPSTIPLLPVQGPQDAGRAPAADNPTDGAEDSPGRGGRQPQVR